MIYGYARVSTTAQSLREQLEQLEQAGVVKENMYKEKFTGTKMNRPEFTKLLSILEDNYIVVVTKLNRFARNTKEALEVVKPNITIDLYSTQTEPIQFLGYQACYELLTFG